MRYFAALALALFLSACGSTTTVPDAGTDAVVTSDAAPDSGSVGTDASPGTDAAPSLDSAVDGG